MSEASILTYYSSRTEDLLESLLYQLEHDETSAVNTPFGRSVILVPNSGMQRYLELKIAERFGICAHIHIGYVGQLLSETYQAVLSGSSPAHIDPRLLTFSLLQLWQNCRFPDDPNFETLYSQHRQPRQRYLLAKRLADLLRQYVNERPEMLTRWQRGESVTQHRHEAWQRQLFQQLAEVLPLEAGNTSDLHHRFSQALGSADGQDAVKKLLPQTIHLFGFHALPVSQWRDINALSQALAIKCYTFNPCVAYWQDIVPEKIKAKLTITDADQAALTSVGHPLLAAWGQAGKFFIEQLNNTANHNFDDLLKDSQAPDSVLKWLQADIRALGEPPVAITDSYASEQKNQLQSLSVHACSTPRREVEVLCDNLCKQFDDGRLNPADVLVIVPRLKDYAAHIEAVFSRPGNQHIPYSLANQSSAESEPDVQAFLSLLAVIDSDFQAQQLFECLSQGQIQRALGLDQNHLDTLRYWFSSSRYSLHFYDHSRGENSSLEKLLDGLLLAAVGGDDCKLGIRSANSHFHSGQQETLEKLSALWQRFLPVANLKAQNLSLSAWCDRFKSLAEHFLPGDHGMDARLNDWYEAVADSDDSVCYDFTTIYTDIADTLQATILHGPFLSGGVSFCAVVPMRSIPAKFIAVLGLNNDFPTLANADPLDLRLDNPLWSDRNSHKEQQYFFLETLMAAREQLYLSYIGLDEKTKEEMPPSALIRELLHYIDRQLPGFSRQALKTYPLQGFISEDSYQTLYNAPEAAPAIDEVENNEAARLPDTLTVAALVEILLAPLMGFWRYNLGAQPLDKLSDRLAEHEFIASDSGLDTWKYRQAALDLALDQHSSAIEALKTNNLYAPSTVSEPLLEQAGQFVAPLVEKLQSYDLSASKPIKAQYRHLLGQQSIYLSLDCTKDGERGLASWHFSKLDGKKLLQAWIKHLLYHCLADSRPCPSLLLTIDRGKVVETGLASIAGQRQAQQLLDGILQFCQMAIQQPYPVTLMLSPKKADSLLHYQAATYSLYPQVNHLDEQAFEALQAQWTVIDKAIADKQL